MDAYSSELKEKSKRIEEKMVAQQSTADRLSNSMKSIDQMIYKDFQTVSS